VFFEHKRLYTLKGQAGGADPVPIGRAAVVREGRDLTIATAMKSVHDALKAAEILAGRGVEAEVVDLRTLSPMDDAAVRRSVEKTGKLVVVEEDVKTAGWGAEVVSRIVEGESFYALDRAPARVAGADVPIPYNRDLEAHVRPTPEKVIDAVRSLLDARAGVYA